MIRSVAAPTLRPLYVLAILLAALASGAPTPPYRPPPPPAARASPACAPSDPECLGRAVLALVNDFRRREGLPALVFSQSLFALARESSTANAEEDALRFPRLSGPGGPLVAAIAQGRLSAPGGAADLPQAVVGQWMGPPSPRSVLLQQADAAGIAVVLRDGGLWWATMVVEAGQFAQI